ncbi:DNA alkylation repair protein [Brevibacterium sp. JSBI002]|nr:DNA alkylation repair protein [Brevibacterium sp. JSBI002]UZD61890.1 DNA alkylation repair protein [Brevibacterium sp. JSBI002]
MVLIQSKDRLGGGDADFIGGLLREAMTWALVDPLAGDLIGPFSERDAAFDPVLERWASDEDFWIRRSALLAHLVPLRHGRGDFDRFSRFADAMLEEKEFFVRKGHRLGSARFLAQTPRPRLRLDPPACPPCLGSDDQGGRQTPVDGTA